MHIVSVQTAENSKGKLFRPPGVSTPERLASAGAERDRKRKRELRVALLKTIKLIIKCKKHSSVGF